MNYSFALSSPVNGLRFCSVDTKSNFKLAIYTASFALPLGKDTAVNALLPGLLKRTCKKYPTLTQMNKHLASLYGAMVSAGVSKDGESQILTLRITALEDRFALTDEKISEKAAELLREVGIYAHEFLRILRRQQFFGHISASKQHVQQVICTHLGLQGPRAAFSYITHIGCATGNHCHDFFLIIPHARAR